MYIYIYLALLFRTFTDQGKFFYINSLSFMAFGSSKCTINF